RIVEQSRQARPEREAGVSPTRRVERRVTVGDQQAAGDAELSEERPARGPVPASGLLGPALDFRLEVGAVALQRAREREQAECGIGRSALGGGGGGAGLGRRWLFVGRRWQQLEQLLG